MFISTRHLFSRTLVASALCLSLAGFGSPAQAQVTAFKQAIAEAASADSAVASHYRSADYEPLWTVETDEGRARRAALLNALESAHMHGLPDMGHVAERLRQQMADVRTTRDLGLVEVALSRAFVDYATDIQIGQVTPSKIDKGIVRELPERDRSAYLSGLERSAPSAFINALPPETREYRALMKEKFRLERLLVDGGWGSKVPVRKMEPGDTGEGVVALRNRLVRMGYLQPTPSAAYDTAMQSAVQRFQLEHGLEADGIAGKGTITEMNVPVEKRLKSIIVAMERERWMNKDRGTRHILVNQTDFTAKVIDDGAVTFVTRSVIGKNTSDRRSPEFSDEMEHMVINPSWYVPRSIITKEYLPQLRANPHAVSHIEITDSRGRRVNRNAVDFSQYSARSFPFAMRQPPSSRNALGLVKFMFPNKHNIYLHDTPHKSLFKHEVRAYSHGCIRLAQPFEFAYAILARQEADPKGYFHSVLNTGKETKVELDQKIPVHIIYRTAFTSPKGRMEYRRDIYDRDAKIWNALESKGVALPSVQG
ncbi:MAG: L,D-transpeptidase family protein [Rhodobacteraceae bacterium]|nr:L,D-transpeptidase family protein [Paracoccaceae bacterium]